MPFPLVPVALLAGLGVIAFAVTRKTTDPNAQPVPGGGPVGPQAPAGAPVMSSQMAQAFQALLAGSDPDAMDATASALDPFGFTTEANRLRLQAAAIRKARLGGVQSPPVTTSLATLPTQRPAALDPNFDPNIQTGTGPGTPGARDLGDVDAPGFLQGAVAAASAALASNGAAPPTALPSFAVVTTSDPAPTGDLMIRPAPNAPGQQGVGAEKNGVVTVLKKDALGDGVWSEIIWGGGPRLGPARGFVKSAFLRASSVGPLGTAIAGSDGGVCCLAPSGCRLRKSPSIVSDFRAIVGNGESVKVLKTVAGPKLESFSPGRGGWAQVQYKNLTGWLPLEWLVRS